MSGKQSFWCRLGFHCWDDARRCTVCGSCRHEWVREGNWSLCQHCPAWDVDEP